MGQTTRSIICAGGIGSTTIALLQPVIYFGGPTFYRVFGAPPYIAQMRAAEPLAMAAWSSVWFALFLTFGLYAFSGAGLFRPVPFLRSGLIAIALTYAVRGLAVVPQLIWFDAFAVTRGRDVAFSGLSLALAVSYATAARRVSPRVAA